MKYQLENFNGRYDFRSRFHEGWSVESHLHEYSELLYCRKGLCRAVVNGSEIALPAGHLLWLPPNYIHQYPDTDAQVICAVFSNDYIPLFFQITGGRRLKIVPVPAEELEEIICRFPALSREEPLRISGYLNLICAKVLAHPEYETARLSDSILYQKVISYLSEHFREDISLKSIARTFGYNEKYLSHALHDLTGIHFSKLLALYRVEHAGTLLRETRLSISEIAMRCGFSAVNSFNRVFKSMTGMTPSEYRKSSRFS